MPEGVIICDEKHMIGFNKFGYDDLEGVYGPEIQQTLYPQNQNHDQHCNNCNDEDENSTTSESNMSESSYSSDTSDNDYDAIKIIHNRNSHNQSETVVEELKGDIEEEEQSIENFIEDIENNIKQEVNELN